MWVLEYTKITVYKMVSFLHFLFCCKKKSYNNLDQPEDLMKESFIV